MIQATLVLEGGATRGVFTSGALDYLMEKDVWLSHVIGVSAGACNGIDYVSRQPGRMKACMIHKEKEYDYYYGVKDILKEKSVINMDMLFDWYPNGMIPFDYDTYFASEIECEMVVTNCETGKAEYMTEEKDGDRLLNICRASSSMPLLSPMVEIDGVPYLDGGLADSVPLARAVKKGNRKIVVMLTRNPGYRKKPVSKGTAKIYRRAFKDYPELARTAILRNVRYNRQMEALERLEREGKVYVLRPQIPVVSRLEKDYDTLMNFYMHGYRQMEKEYDTLMQYLEG